MQREKKTKGRKGAYNYQSSLTESEVDVEVDVDVDVDEDADVEDDVDVEADIVPEGFPS